MSAFNKPWQAGRPILTPADTAAWQVSRKARILAAQRDRRAKYRRIDYYPSPEAAEIIDALTTSQAGGDYSSVIDWLVIATDIPE